MLMPDLTPEQIETINLADFIEAKFTLSQLPKLCDQLGLDYDNLGGSTKEAKARNLAKQMANLGESAKLHEVLYRERP